MAKKLFMLAILLFSGFFSAALYASPRCDYKVSLTTASGWYYEGSGSSYMTATNDAINKCIRSGTIPRACRDGEIRDLDRDCDFVCTIVTDYGWTYTGTGRSEYTATNNAITKCIQDGTIPNACRNASVSCE